MTIGLICYDHWAYVFDSLYKSVHRRRVHHGSDGDNPVKVVVLQKHHHDLKCPLYDTCPLFDVLSLNNQLLEVQGKLEIKM